MSQRTLELDYNTLRRQLGIMAGWGGDAGAWGDEKSITADEIISDGFKRAFYAIDPRNGTAVQWSFVTPSRILHTAANQKDYDLPADFGGLVGKITFSDSDNGVMPIEICSANEISKRRQLDGSSNTGKPIYAASDQQLPTQLAGTRYRLMLWPTPDADYTLAYQSIYNPAPLSEANPHPPGGPMFSNLLKAAIFAEFEARFNDGQTTWAQQFTTALVAAVAHEGAMDPDTIPYPVHAEAAFSNHPQFCRNRGTITYPWQ